MPRKTFLKDLEEAAQPGRFPRIVSVRAGEDAGTVRFTCVSDILMEGEVVIEALIPEVADYPNDHQFLLYTTGEETPSSVGAALESIRPTLGGYNLSEMLEAVSNAIDQALSDHMLDPDAFFDNESDAELEAEAPSEEEYDIDELWSTDPSNHAKTRNGYSSFSSPYKGPPNKVSRKRLRSDLRAAKAAGFKVGMLGDLAAGGFVCISIRVLKLGLSEEALQAWALKRSHYLVLLIKFEEGYQTLDMVIEGHSKAGKSKAEIRIALSKQYKPSAIDITKLFEKNANNQDSKGDLGTSERSSLENLFIETPLNDLFRDRFAGIIKYRLACGFSWTGAETFYHDVQGMPFNSIDARDSKYSIPDDTASRALPPIVKADQISQMTSERDLSFPLVTMQFLLRHFVRCTEFCLVCHCKIDATFEALKPYVCDKPLCLYQYMTLGFGPSVEWEILAQPYVVDLLISFCYVGAKNRRLREFPIGIDLKVPRLPQNDCITELLQARQKSPSPNLHKNPSLEPQTPFLSLPDPISGKFDLEQMELLFADRQTKCPFKAGDWIVVYRGAKRNRIHTRVNDISLWPLVKLANRVIEESAAHKTSKRSQLASSTPGSSPEMKPRKLVDVQCYKYDQPFDSLHIEQMNMSIMILLETLPSVLDMENFLREKTVGRDFCLRHWNERISDSALNLLRWIIASNRSCIMQVDETGSTDPAIPDQCVNEPNGNIKSPSIIFEERVSGMSNWLQFRFAQGAPDKEQRFVNCVNEVAKRTNTKYPTLFAWHGSSLGNWHSIIRSGLDFKDTSHGRAFGHGVYMSNQLSTSTSYSNLYNYGGPYGGDSSFDGWPRSLLRISTAISLNEVVNAPAEFTSCNPHYVVNDINWIQTRYLFIKADNQYLPFNVDRDKMPKRVYIQDPARLALNDRGEAIQIPITAVSKSRRLATVQPSKDASDRKKRKSFMETASGAAERHADDVTSIATDEDDVANLLSSDEDVEPTPRKKGDLFKPSQQDKLLKMAAMIGTSSKPRLTLVAHTGFFPDTLDFRTIKLLEPPKDGSTGASKILLKTLRDTLKVQESTLTQDLGWYIHHERITNIYQWIVELHSFPADLPLTEDMKSAGLSSIVLELRFTESFPFAPPFVRVVQPRFLPFALGGGGHVTAGGALCMELLTGSGWLPGTSLESVLLQVRLAVMSRDPKPARLEGRGRVALGSGLNLASGPGGSYGVGEAVEAFKRACMMHGWTVPAGFEGLAKEW